MFNISGQNFRIHSAAVLGFFSAAAVSRTSTDGPARHEVRKAEIMLLEEKKLRARSGMCGSLYSDMMREFKDRRTVCFVMTLGGFTVNIV